MKKHAQFSLHWGRCCTAPNELPNAGPGDAPKGASPGLGGGQRLPLCLLLHCFRLLSISWEGDGGCSGVCSVPHAMLHGATHRTAPVNAP